MSGPAPRRLHGQWRRWRKYPLHHLLIGAAHRLGRALRRRVPLLQPGPRLRPSSTTATSGSAAGRLGVGAVAVGTLPSDPPFAGAASDRVLEEAERAAAHEFDLLGSGPTRLEPEIDWHLDFKSGVRWPVGPARRLPYAIAPGADVKVPWELGRCLHFGPLVQAWLLSGEQRWATETVAQMRHFVAANPVGFGVQWMSAMDAAIRAINWTYAFAALHATRALSDADRERWLDALWDHLRFLRANLSWNPHSRGNHYLSEVVGLLHLGLLFGDTTAGRRVARDAARWIRREMRVQVRPDGTNWEASTNYHRLVSELMALAGHLLRTTTVDLGLGEDPRFEERLERMLAFVAGYTRSDGTAPLIGDVDDGRVLGFGPPLGTDPRRHLDLLAGYGAPAEPATDSGAWSDGGFYVLRAGATMVAVRCGPVGLRGRGAHDHADQLSVDVTLDGVPLVVDPGTYCYTADPALRRTMRGTPRHNTVTVDGTDQMVFSAATLFEVDLGATGRADGWRVDRTGTTFEGAHDGYRRLRPPVRHHRRVRVPADGRSVEIQDRVGGSGAREVRVTFQLAPGWQPPTQLADGVVVEGPGGRRVVVRQVEGPALAPRLEPSFVAPRYGVRQAAPRVVFEGHADLPAALTFVIAAADQAA